ncbi:TIGR00730 family Rossman fold protein [Candidatus Nitrospira neomarina]|uniref:AMP nucleosidase n=1 Tax=Candidatus Nitrospira neomarina TaxID=3020899 RepID=A0AA96GFZ0_9BACT|nr:TIGR00730 family Rossman fold protein [Candidatus Nitrospira neomarina]WNM61041.1 TIGR00730 family Rossman fold protein [Candidatus Nitrospira neomarina]
MSLRRNATLKAPSDTKPFRNTIVLEEEIVREIKTLWTGPDTDVRTALLKEMVGSVVGLRDLDTDVIDVKILHRALKELRHSFRVFRQYREVKKVSIFGSARTPGDDPNYKLASQLGKLLSQRGFMVITGGGPGIMLAGNEGAGRDNSFGVNIMLPFEQAPNAMIADDKKLVHLKYFFSRKLLLVKESHAVALFPGGFGTLDEAFEVLTLIQTGKTHPIPVVCIESPGGDYWKQLMEFFDQQLLSRGFINRSDLALFKIVYSAEEAVKEIQQFFRVYHSLRIVKNSMVIRIHQQLSQAEMAQLNQEFSDLLADGQFQQVEALPEEWDEPHISHLPRLMLHFNWKELGRLRQCIDWLNARA